MAILACVTKRAYVQSVTNNDKASTRSINVTSRPRGRSRLNCEKVKTKNA